MNGQPQIAVPNPDHPVTDQAEYTGVTDVPPEDDPTQYKGGEFRDDIGDGIDESTLPEEDDSEIPETVG